MTLMKLGGSIVRNIETGSRIKNEGLMKDLMNISQTIGAEHYNYYRNGITDHGTFVGTCKLCGIVWEFRSVEVIPVPYPHGICPKCHQWIAVF